MAHLGGDLQAHQVHQHNGARALCRGEEDRRRRGGCVRCGERGAGLCRHCQEARCAVCLRAVPGGEAEDSCIQGHQGPGSGKGSSVHQSATRQGLLSPGCCLVRSGEHAGATGTGGGATGRRRWGQQREGRGRGGTSRVGLRVQSQEWRERVPPRPTNSCAALSCPPWRAGHGVYVDLLLQKHHQAARHRHPPGIHQGCRLCSLHSAPSRAQRGRLQGGDASSGSGCGGVRAGAWGGGHPHRQVLMRMARMVVKKRICPRGSPECRRERWACRGDSAGCTPVAGQHAGDSTRARAEISYCANHRAVPHRLVQFPERSPPHSKDSPGDSPGGWFRARTSSPVPT